MSTQQGNKRPQQTEEEDFWTRIETMMDRSSNKVVTQLGGRITKFEKSQEELATRTEALEKRMDSNEEKLFTIGEPGSSRGFVPKSVWLKNFCPYDERKTQGMSRPQMTSLLAKLKSSLDESLQDKVGDFVLAGTFNHKVKVCVSPGYALEIAGTWRERLEKPDIQFNHRTIKCVAERHPEVQKRFDKAGKVMAWLRSVAPDGEPRCTWQPEFLLKVATGMGSSHDVGKINEDASVTWYAAGLANGIKDMTPGKAGQELGVFGDAGRA